MPHLPRRPEWVCVADRDVWPCPWARAVLVEAVDVLAVERLMVVYLGLAARDISDPAVLWGRFLAWTQPGSVLVGAV